LAAGGIGAGAAASADGVAAGVGIVIAGFFAAGVCFEDSVDCAGADGSRWTGVRGPAPAAGVSVVTEGCGAAVAGSAARDTGAAVTSAAEISSSQMAVFREPARRSCGVGGCGIAPPVLGVD
jgi:hypothetical protein